MTRETPLSDPILLRDAAARAERYLEELDARGVAPSPAEVAALAARLEAPLPEAPSDAAKVLAEIDAWGSPATVATAGRRFFGFVTGGALPATVAASWLAAAWDQNCFKKASSPTGTLFEAAALRWLLALLGLPADAGAAFVTGATMANFSALAAARHALLEARGWDVEARGLCGAPRVPVVLSAESHPTVRKSLGLLGLGREPDVLLATDEQGRVRADALPSLDRPSIVCVQAGNVNSGASDPFAALRAWCDESGSWLHVDGAFGLWAAAVPSLRHRVAGVELADSWATDAHKWLNVPYDSGVAFVRRADALRHAMRIDAPYFPDETDRDPFDFTPDSSRRARGLEVWAALRQLGRAGVVELVERCCAHARRAAAALGDAGFEVLNEVALNQVVVTFGDDARCNAVAARVVAEGDCWIGTTHWRDRPAIRLSFSSWATRDEDVDRLVAAVGRAAKATEASTPAA